MKNSDISSLIIGALVFAFARYILDIPTNTILLFVAAFASAYAAGTSFDIWHRLREIQDDINDLKKKSDRN